mgnify:CR=1 FL=1
MILFVWQHLEVDSYLGECAVEVVTTMAEAFYKLISGYYFHRYR